MEKQNYDSIIILYYEYFTTYINESINMNEYKNSLFNDILKFDTNLIDYINLYDNLQNKLTNLINEINDMNKLTKFVLSNGASEIIINDNNIN